MLASTKALLLVGTLGLTAPACALVLGDFDPLSSSASSGGVGGALSSSGGPVTSAGPTSGQGGAGGVTSGNGGATTAGSVTTGSGTVGSSGPGSTAASSTAASSTSVAASSSSSGGTCSVPCDAKPCYDTSCVGGTCKQAFSSNTTPCSGGTCDGDGHCMITPSTTTGSGGIACTIVSDCPGPVPLCQQATCLDNVCGMIDLPLGTACTSNGIPSVCNGMGQCGPVATMSTGANP